MNDIKVTIGGRELPLRYSFNALCEMEAALGAGRPALRVIAEMGDMRWRDLRALLWAGALHDPKAPSLSEVGVLVNAELEAAKHVADGHRKLYARLYEAVSDALIRGGVVQSPDAVAAEDTAGNAEAATAP